MSNKEEYDFATIKVTYPGSDSEPPRETRPLDDRTFARKMDRLQDSVDSLVMVWVLILACSFLTQCYSTFHNETQIRRALERIAQSAAQPQEVGE